MKKLTFWKSLFLLCALIVGTSTSWADKVTLQYTNTSTTTNMTGGNDAATLGLSATDWSVVGDKGGSAYFPGLNKSKYIALYYNADGCNTLTITALKANTTINSIEITYTAATYNNGKVYVGDNEVTGSSGTYTINNTSCVITNGNTSNTQVRISKIDINYTTASAYTITAQSNNNSWGTVSGTTTITASPAEGYRVVAGDGGYTVTAGTATVTNNGDNTFSVTPESNCTVIINFEAIPTHTLSSAVSPAGAGSVALGSSSIKEGSTTTATATAYAGYKFTGWSISGTGASLSSTSANPTTVTMGTADATVTATFEAVTTYEIKWSVNGTIVKTENVEEDTPINFAAPTSGVPTGYVFKGWVTEAHKINTPTNTDPSENYVTSGNSEADITYYAVMASVTGSAPESWTETALADMEDTDIFVFSDGEVAMNNDCVSAAPGQNAITVVNGEITSEVADNLKWQVSGDAENGYTFYPNGSTTTWLVCNTTSGSSNNNNIRVSDGARKVWIFTASGFLKTKDTYTDRYLCKYNEQDFRGYTSTGNAFVPIFYKYTAASATYGGYCTTVPPTNVTVTDLETASGGKYTGKNYATMYYSNRAFAVPAGVVAKTYKMVSGVLTESRTYENGGTYPVIPAGEAVVLESDAATNYSFAASSTETTPDAENALCGTDATTTVDETGYKYYKLAMNNSLDKVGFFYDNADGSAINNGAHKAYLRVAANTEAKNFYLFGEDATTGIANLNVNDNLDVNAPMYNLAGQRVNKSYKGVVIVNGKKMLNK